MIGKEGDVPLLKIKCPICGNAYINHAAVYSHITRVHSEEIPEGMPPDQYFYDMTHNGKKSYCVICKKETPWNERTHKYHRLCGSASCARKNREIFKERMMRSKGTYNLATDPDHQRKMLAGRSISGEYEWSSGGKTAYVGSYEKDFLNICDTILDLHQEDIIQSPHTYEYTYEGKKHFYMPDFYIPDLNLEIEIKDGGDNPNLHHKIIAVDKEKERLKDNVMMKQTNHHYIKITNKNYGDFIDLTKKLVQQDITPQEDRNKIKIVPSV